MDPLAHTLIGIGIARAGLAQKYGRGTTLTLAIASMLPDIDVMWTAWDSLNVWTLRRTHSHALIAIPVFAALYALLTRRWLKHIPPLALTGLVALGVSGHILADLLNAYGVVILWPFTRARFELASVFIIDIGIWAILVAPLLASRWMKSPARAFQAALAVLVLYAGVCVGMRYRAESLVTGPSVRVFPEPFGPHRFRVVVREGDTYRLYLVRVLSGTVELRGTFATNERSARVAACRCTRHGQTIDWFAAAPVWSEEPDGTVEVFDLRFKAVTIDRPNPFVVQFRPESHGPLTGSRSVIVVPFPSSE